MTTTHRTNSELTNHRARPGRAARPHRLPMCTTTGLARYRDRHQARHAAEALRAGRHAFDVHTFACPDCRGFHLERAQRHEPLAATRAPERTAAFAASLATRRRRYVLVDIENPTRGARATCGEVKAFWDVLIQQAPGLTHRDHVVVGAARQVARKYRAAIYGPNVKWVVGANAPDGADRALLAAIDLHRVARDYDELVIVSGDHAFAGLARRAKALGLLIQVITTEHPTQRSMLSRELSAAADVRTLVRCRSRAVMLGNVTAMKSVARASYRTAQSNSVAA